MSVESVFPLFLIPEYMPVARNPLGTVTLPFLSQWNSFIEVVLGDRESRYLNGSFACEVFSVKFDPLHLMDGLRCHITLTAMRTINNRHIFNHEKRTALAVGSGHSLLPCFMIATIVTFHKIFYLSVCIHGNNH